MRDKLVELRIRGPLRALRDELNRKAREDLQLEKFATLAGCSVCDSKHYVFLFFITKFIILNRSYVLVKHIRTFFRMI